VVAAGTGVVAAVATVTELMSWAGDPLSITSGEAADVLPPSTCVLTSAAAEPATSTPAIEITMAIFVFII
jgi:hypothetical protein